MSAQIIPICDQSAVDFAWTEYAALAERAIAEPKLLTDRKFFEEFTRKEARFKQLFMARERA